MDTGLVSRRLGALPQGLQVSRGGRSAPKRWHHTLAMDP